MSVETIRQGAVFQNLGGQFARQHDCPGQHYEAHSNNQIGALFADKDVPVSPVDPFDHSQTSHKDVLDAERIDYAVFHGSPLRVEVPETAKLRMEVQRRARKDLSTWLTGGGRDAELVH